MAEFTVTLDGVDYTVSANDPQSAARAAKQAHAARGQQPTERGVLGKAADWLKGANRDEGIPSALTAGLGLNPAQSARMTALLGTTVSDDRMQRGLMEIEPGVQFDKDSRGQLVAVFPVRDQEGNEIGRKKFYPNAPGLDVTDALIGSGVAALAQPLGTATRMVGLRGLPQSAAIGGFEGAAAEGASATLTKSPFQVMDPIVGALGGVGGDLALRGVTSLVRLARASGPRAVIGSDGNLLPEIEKQVRDAGLDPSQVREEFARELVKEVRSGAQPDDAATIAGAKSLPVPVPLTKGQITGSKGQQLFEDAAFSGAMGGTAEGIMRGQRAKAQEALRGNLDAMLRSLAPGRAPVARGEGGAEAQEALVGIRDFASDRADALYEQARRSPAVIQTESGTEVAEATRNIFREGFSPTTAPTVDAMLREFDEVAASGDLKRMMEWRAQLSGLGRGAPTVDAAAAADILPVFDTTLKQAVDHQMLAGDPAAVGQWFDAIENYADFAKLWKSKGGMLSTLTEEVGRDGNRVLKVAPEAAANAIFTATASGMARKVNLPRDLITLKKHLPEEQWNALRQEAFIRLMDTADGPVRNGEQTVSGTNFFKAWTTLTDQNRGTVNALFTPEERKLVTQFASIAARATGGAVNASNSANMAAGLIQRLAGATGGTRIAQFLMRVPIANTLTGAMGTVRALSATTGGPPQFRNPVGAGAGAAALSSDDGKSELERRLRAFTGFAR